jgi:hypothetical protein
MDLWDVSEPGLEIGVDAGTCRVYSFRAFFFTEWLPVLKLFPSARRIELIGYTLWRTCIVLIIPSLMCTFIIPRDFLLIYCLRSSEKPFPPPGRNSIMSVRRRGITFLSGARGITFLSGSPLISEGSLFCLKFPRLPTACPSDRRCVRMMTSMEHCHGMACFRGLRCFSSVPPDKCRDSTSN